MWVLVLLLCSFVVMVRCISVLWWVCFSVISVVLCLWYMWLRLVSSFFIWVEVWVLKVRGGVLGDGGWEIVGMVVVL